MNENPLISVCVITYQHANYIAKCLDSILMQETSIPFEIIIGEDGSSDGTREICNKYAKEYPSRIRLFLRDRNDPASRKVLAGRYNFIETLKAAESKYVALCDGDDYWSDPNKLETEFTFLEKNPDYILVGHNSRINENGIETDRTIKIIENDHIDVSTADFIQRNPFINSMSMFRNIGFNGLIDILNNFTVGDRSLFTLLSLQGKCRFTNKVVGYYRLHSSSETSGNRNQYRKFRRDLINRLNHANYWNAYTGHKFESEKNLEVRKRSRQIANLALRNYDLKTAIFYSHYIELNDLTKINSKITVALLKSIYKIVRSFYSNNYEFKIVQVEQ